MQIEASHVITACIRCNTAQQFLGTEEQARSAGFYACKYCGKDPVKMNIIVLVLHMMDKRRESKAEEKSDLRDTQFWLTRALNNFSSMCEFSDTQIASSLMGIDSYHTSHKFWTFHAKSFVNYQRTHFAEGEMRIVEPDIVDHRVHSVLPSDGTTDDDDWDQGEPYVTEDKELRVQLQHEHYKRRGSELQDLTPYEWAAIIKVEKIPNPDTRSQRNARFSFEKDGTDWWKTHRQVLRTKFVVLHRDAPQHSLGVRHCVSVWILAASTVVLPSSSEMWSALTRIPVHGSMSLRPKYRHTRRISKSRLPTSAGHCTWVHCCLRGKVIGGKTASSIRITEKRKYMIGRR